MASELEHAASEPDCQPEVLQIDIGMPLEVRGLPKFDKGLRLSVKEARLLNDPPWVRSLGKMNLEVSTDGWRFPTVQDSVAPPLAKPPAPKVPVAPGECLPTGPVLPTNGGTKIRPTQDNLALKERLLY